MLEELVEWQEDLRLIETPSNKLSYPVSALLQTEQCQSFLQEMSSGLGVTNPMVTASLFAKQYSYSLVVSTLWSMSLRNRALPVNIENCTLEWVQEEERWMPYLRLIEWKVTEPGKDRASWRDQVLIQLIRDHLTPVWKTLHRLTGLSMLVLWENMAVYIYWLYQIKLKESSLTKEQLAQAEADYCALVFALPAQYFGERMQPLRRLLAGLNPEKRQRKTCCLNYLACDGQAASTCTICPRRRIKEGVEQKQVTV